MISIRELTKSFDANRAVDHISFDIPEGMMFGLLGTNGAGKTTLLRLLSGILEPVCTRALSCACSVNPCYGSLRALSDGYRSAVRVLRGKLYAEEHSCLWGILSDLLSFRNSVCRNLWKYYIRRSGLCGRNPVFPDTDREYLRHTFEKLFYYILQESAS